MENGCLCCSAKDDVIATLDAILSRGSGPSFDYVRGRFESSEWRFQVFWAF